jgi:hypothetical protein
MRKFLFLLVFIPLVSFGQNFQISDFMDLDENAENGKKIIKNLEALMIRNDLRMLEKTQYYDYYILKNCNVGNKDRGTEFVDDGFSWQCTSSHPYKDKFGNTNSFNYRQYPPQTNYREEELIISEFAKNYNSLNETAEKWVELRYYKKIQNNNYKNKFEIDKQSFKINFQFSNKSGFDFLKRGILDVAEYDYTLPPLYGGAPTVNYIYKKNGRTIQFTIREKDETSHIGIIYSCSNCTAFD